VRPWHGVTVRLISGEAGGVRGPVRDIVVPIEYMDISMEPGASLEKPVPDALRSFLFVLDGPQISPAIDAQLSALPGVQQLGADRCLAMGRATMCVRAEDGRAVMVVASGDPADSSGVPLTTRVAGWTDTAWADTQ
jgi:redox-sensitive bicupin YhaK (pirin superfamily)